jgi:hypothetical protein
MKKKRHGNEDEISRKYLDMRNKFNKIRDDIKKQNTFLTVRISFSNFFVYLFC